MRMRTIINWTRIRPLKKSNGITLWILFFGIFLSSPMDSSACCLEFLLGLTARWHSFMAFSIMDTGYGLCKKMYQMNKFSHAQNFIYSLSPPPPSFSPRWDTTYEAQGEKEIIWKFVCTNWSSLWYFYALALSRTCMQISYNFRRSVSKKRGGNILTMKK